MAQHCLNAFFQRKLIINIQTKNTYKHKKGYILIGGLVEYNHEIIETNQSVCVIRIKGLFTDPMGLFFIFTYVNPTDGFTHGHTCVVQSVVERFRSILNAFISSVNI